MKQVVHHPKEYLKSLPTTSTWLLDCEAVVTAAQTQISMEGEGGSTGLCFHYGLFQIRGPPNLDPLSVLKIFQRATG